MPKIDMSKLAERMGTDYPSPFDEPVRGRVRQALARAGGLTDIGVNLVHLPSGAWSSQRHWHSREEEFVYVLAGELTLLTENDEQVLRAGDCAAFPKNVPDGHHMINRGDSMAVYLDIGTHRADDTCSYSDIDLHIGPEPAGYAHKNGTAYRP